jgi:uncharacterized protein YacL
MTLDSNPNDQPAGQPQQTPYNQRSNPPFPPMPPYFAYPPQPLQKRKVNSTSIVAMIVGICSVVIPFIGIAGILAIILASISFKEMNLKAEEGRGMAIAGLVCGIIGIVLFLIIAALVVIFILAAAQTPSSTFSNEISI